jgi:hypothetical protein
VALAAPAWAKPKQCLMPAEITAEQTVRHGIFLREAARRCQEDGYVTGTWKKWQTFDQRFGNNLKSATSTRTRAYQREFPNASKAELTQADGKIVTYYRHYPLTRAYCEDVDELLGELTGFGAFTSQAKLLQDEVRMAYKVCQ